MPVLTRNDVKSMYNRCQEGITYNEIPDKFKHLLNEPVPKKHQNKLLLFDIGDRSFFYYGIKKNNGKSFTYTI